MDWYYASKGARQGPVDELALRTLIAQGAVDGTTLVWNSTMKDWVPLSATSLATVSIPEGHAQCIVNGRVFPQSQMFLSEHGWVSAEAKDTYYQSLREGIAPNRAIGGSFTAWRDGKRMVIPVSGGELPPRCVKTNAPVSPAEVRHRTFFWAPTWIIVTILLSWIITIILYFVMRKKVIVPLPLSAEANRRINTGKWSAAGGAALGFVVIIAGAIQIETNPALIIGGVVLLLASLIVGLRFGRLLSITKIDNGRAWVNGVHPDYLASLPPYQP